MKEAFLLNGDGKEGGIMKNFNADLIREVHNFEKKHGFPVLCQQTGKRFTDYLESNLLGYNVKAFYLRIGFAKVRLSTKMRFASQAIISIVNATVYKADKSVLLSMNLYRKTNIRKGVTLFEYLNCLQQFWIALFKGSSCSILESATLGVHDELVYIKELNNNPICTIGECLRLDMN